MPNSLATHYLVEFNSIDINTSHKLETEKIKKDMIEAIQIALQNSSSQNSKLQINESSNLDHYSLAVLAQETHFLLHYFSNRHYAAVDIFSTQTDLNIQRAIDSLSEAFNAKQVSWQKYRRGTGGIHSSLDDARSYDFKEI